jgi:hypothetical protein
MCIWDSYVYQEGVLCLFFVHESYVRSVRGYCFVCNYAAVPVQLDIVILQYCGWCVLLLILLLLLLLLLIIIIIIIIVIIRYGYLLSQACSSWYLNQQ